MQCEKPTRLHYPQDMFYDYFVTLQLLNLDEAAKVDLSNAHAFQVSSSSSLIKDLKSDTSIFSSKFGRSMNDDVSEGRYSCKYGCTQSKFRAVKGNERWYCPHCHTEIKLVGDDFTYFGYIVLAEPYHIIAPAMYMMLTSLIGKDNLENILEPEVNLDINGNPMSAYDKKIMKRKAKRMFKKKTSGDTKYEAIGMTGFYKNFDEIVNYFYSKKKSTKKELYELIMSNRDKVFTHSIPVYTTQLRIAKVEAKRFTFEKTNANYNLLTKLAATLNRDNLSIYRNEKLQNQLLWDMQVELNKLAEEIIRILEGKKGIMRSTISGRTSFSERSVIVPDATLRMDEVMLPYTGLVLLLEQVIVNILHTSYNITYAAAYKIWYYATLQQDQRVLDIINNLIKMDKIHVLINRNPTIHYESIVWKRVIGVNTDSLVLSVDPYILVGLNADFDGDTLNIKLLLNQQYDRACEEIYSPRNAFCISRDDGLFNNDISIIKDTIINTEAFRHMTRKNYTQDQLDKIKEFKNKYIVA